MQITVQMLDGSIAPFKVRSTITIASLKAKMEPWQSMKGRALLHHGVHLEDRSTLDSVPGIKEGTILRVDKHLSPMKRKTTKKRVMSGPVSLAVDEDVMESIEESGDDEEMASDKDQPLPSSKRKCLSRAWAATVDDLVDDANTANAPRGKALAPDEMSNDSPDVGDADLSHSILALRIARKEKMKDSAHERALVSAPQAQNSAHRSHFFGTISKPPSADPVTKPTSSAHTPQSTEDPSSHLNFVEDDATTFLAGINAAAAETERLPPHSGTRPGEDALPTRCNACGRACWCVRVSLSASKNVVPAEDTIQEREAASTSGKIEARRIAERFSADQHAESIWTGM
ncbi:hypothetical protein BDR22DRAFT_437755 [Usnea florida]